MKSIWQEVELPKFPSLSGDKKTDVLIIGGGLCGLLCAAFLRQNGVDCVVVEKGRICSGVSGNTTAKITAQHGLVYQKLYSRFGAQTAREYLDLNLAALGDFERMATGMDCDFERKESAVYALSDCREIEREAEILQKIGYSAKVVQKTDLPFSVGGAVVFEHQAQFHPLKFAAALTQGLTIYENTFVRELVGTTAVTDTGKIEAKEILVATHFPFLNKHGLYFMKMYQYRSYVLALKGAPLTERMYVDAKESGLSFRTYKDLLLLGGAGAHTGRPAGAWGTLRAAARRYYPEAKEVAHWATQDCITLDEMPYVGPYSATTKHLWVATGFNKWGMTGSMVAAKRLCQQILGKSAQSDILSPARSIWHKQLLVNGFNAAANLLSFSPKRCPHLGCALQWNAAEHTWDCPCHGSRFSKEGRVLDNPANGDLPAESTREAD